jgi:integrase/recombinase XerD
MLEAHPMTTHTPLPPTVEDWIASQRATLTRTGYRTTATQWAEWLAGRGKTIHQATRRDGDDWRTHLVAIGRSPRTINTRLAGVASLCAYLTEHQQIHGPDGTVLDTNPLASVRRLAVDNHEVETAALDQDGARALLDAAAAAGPRTHVAVAVLVHTAIRANEILTLDCSAIKTEAGTLTIRVHRKGGKRDVLPLTDRLAHDVEALRAGRRSGPLIRVEATDAPWTYSQLHHAVHAAGRRAGIDGVTPHVCRATWATLAIAAGVPLAHVQDVMGHSSADTTRRYDRRRDEAAGKLSAMRVVEDLLRGTS